jgi:hypothetical protein
MRLAEIILGALCVLSVILKCFFIPGSPVLAVFSFTLLSVYYFVFTLPACTGIQMKDLFKKESYNNAGEKFSFILIVAVPTGLALSAIIMGLLFVIQLWPMALVQIQQGIVLMAIALVIAVVRYGMTRSDFYLPVFKRMLVIGGIGLFFLLMPANTWLRIQYRNYPEYIEAMEALWKDPENVQLQENLSKEYEKIWGMQFVKTNEPLEK